MNCEVCHLHVASHDPRKVVLNGNHYHQGCLGRKPTAPVKTNCRVKLQKPDAVFDAAGLWLLRSKPS